MKKTLLIVLFVLLAPLSVLAQEATADNGTADNAPAVEAPADGNETAVAAPEVPETAVEEAAPAEEVAPPPSPKGEPKDLSDAVETGTNAVKYFKEGDWLLGISAVLMLLVFFLRKFWTSLPKAWAPWLSVGIGVVGSTASAWAMGEPLVTGLLYGVSAGLGAIGGWEALGKQLLKKEVSEATS